MSQSGAVISLVDVGGKSRKVKLHQELASGGAGAVYSVHGEVGTVVKIYRNETLMSEGAEYAEKLACMLRHVPSLQSNSDFVQIAWPFALANDLSGKFIGFAMPAVDFHRTELLESMLQPRQAELKGLRSDLGARITVAANLAEVVSAIHKEGHQIVDLKPPNLRLYRMELYVSVLDCDGFHVTVPGRTLSAPQATPEYLAPEFQSNPITNSEQQDRFALAVILFRILNFGIHPYDGLARDKNAPTDREGKITKGMYAYGIRPIAAVSPLSVSAHHTFPSELRQSFDRAFVSAATSRPSAREWCDVLRKYAERNNALLQACNAGHLWFTGKPCGECHRYKELNRNRAAAPAPVFELNRIWQEIKFVVPTSVVKEIEPEAYTQEPSPLPRKVVNTERLVKLQKILAFAFVPLLFWVTNIHLVFLLAIFGLWYRYPFGKSALRLETEARMLKLDEAKKKYAALKDEWDKFGSESIFEEQLKKLRDYKEQYESLGENFQDQLNSVLNQIREERLTEFLENTLIEPGIIEGIGAALIEKLESHKIFSAANISRNKIAQIPGFGQVREDRIIEWRDDLIDSFDFDPTDALKPADVAALKLPFDKKAEALENLLQQGPAILKNCKIKILKYRQHALRPLCDAAKELRQASLDLSILK